MAGPQAPAARLPLVVCVVVALLAAAPAHVAAQPSILVLMSTDPAPSNFHANQATNAGFSVTSVNTATFLAMNTGQFSTYDAIVFGDPFCTLTSPPPEIAAAASRWGPAVEGNVILVAGDPAWHAQPAVTQTFIEYAAHDGRTGLYMSLSCYDHDSFGFLDTVFGDAFVTVSANFDDAVITAKHPALTPLTPALLADWGESMHARFTSWPDEWVVIAAMTDAPPTHALPLLGGGTTNAAPWIIGRGDLLVPADCGDSVRDPAREECDDGNNTPLDGCAVKCTLECGDGSLNAALEECDDGNRTPGDGCDALCRIEVCGNGRLDVGENCEDGNTDAGDGCSPICMVEECQNGYVDPLEDCDDGNDDVGDGCDENCYDEICGNGRLQFGEECDDDNLVNGDGCDSSCLREECGNGVPQAGEDCDDGNAVEGDGCDLNCIAEVCGNGVTQFGEECDDGNFVSGDGCHLCLTECGNGVVNAPGEQCDDGGFVNFDGCHDDCQLEASIVLTSNRGGHGDKFYQNTVQITATFTPAVSGVTLADFQLVPPNLHQSVSLSPVNPNTVTQVWVVTIILNPWPEDTFITAAFVQGSGNIRPFNLKAARFGPVYSPPTPILSSPNAPSTGSPTIYFDCDFAPALVKFVTMDNFEVTVSSGATFTASVTNLSPIVPVDTAATWRVTVVIDPPYVPADVTIKYKRLGIHPPTRHASGPFTVQFIPARPVLSSNVGPDGTGTYWPRIVFYADFDYPISGMQPSDWHLTQTQGTNQVAVTQGGGGSVWSLELLIDPPRLPAEWSVNILANSGAILPANSAAVNGPFSIRYEPPVPRIHVYEANSQSISHLPDMGVLISWSVNVTGVVMADYQVAYTGGPFQISPLSKGVLSESHMYRFTIHVPPLSTGRLTIWVVEDSGVIEPPNAASSPLVYTIDYVPVTVVLTSDRGAHGDTTKFNVIRFVATFSQPVTGVTRNHFNVTAAPFTWKLQQSSSGPIEWWFTITLTAPVAPSTVSAMFNAINVPPAPSPIPRPSNRLTLLHAPPSVSFSSGQAPATNVHAIRFTATFSNSVSGVTSGAFQFTTVPHDISLSTVIIPGPSTTEYVVETTINDPPSRGNVTVSIRHGSGTGAVYPLAQSGGPFAVFYDAPPAPTLAAAPRPFTHENQVFFIATFSTPVSGVSPSNLVVNTFPPTVRVGGISGAALSPTQYLFNVTILANAAGDVTAWMPEHLGVESPRQRTSNSATVRFAGRCAPAECDAPAADAVCRPVPVPAPGSNHGACVLPRYDVDTATRVCPTGTIYCVGVDNPAPGPVPGECLNCAGLTAGPCVDDSTQLCEGYGLDGTCRAGLRDCNECSSNPCHMGTCVDLHAGHVCECLPGWEGAACDTFNDCLTLADPCNGGICTDGDGDFTCTNCPLGWTGPRCRTEIDPCDPDPCDHGTCRAEGLEEVTCDCHTGYAGEFCDRNFDDCIGNTACDAHGGFCVDAVASFFCACPQGQTGPVCEDYCPNNPNKLVPGQCGCSVPDSDSDLDGVVDCLDDCPFNAGKTTAGVCGCSGNDNDSDSDGSPNCVDGCPNDPLKIAPGSCGCGASDVDTDGDGSPDCVDECVNDPLKITRGACGCGATEADSDGDGTPNCVDQCPNDPLKSIPGVCGCGQADVDSDGDGALDCVDLCPADGTKTVPGACGCGTPDTDTDGDGSLDCQDQCPNDASHVVSGVCGCGVPETDSDGDGVPNCVDGCPSDPTKVAAGTCGCGVPDIDADGDGTPNCNDGCPSDPLKTAPGVCGCGASDTLDGNGNGTPDCQEQCYPSNPCQNGGTCSEAGPGAFTCACDPGYHGPTCSSIQSCPVCSQGTLGPCVHHNDQTCLPYVSNTGVCTPGSSSCFTTTAFGLPGNECGTCATGSSGPCRHLVTGQCTAYAHGDACASGYIACGPVSVSSINNVQSGFGYYTVLLDGVSADSIGDAQATAVHNAAAAAANGAASDVELRFAVDGSNTGQAALIGFTVIGTDLEDDALELTQAVDSGDFATTLQTNNVAAVSASDLRGTLVGPTTPGSASGGTGGDTGLGSGDAALGSGDGSTGSGVSSVGGGTSAGQEGQTVADGANAGAGSGASLSPVMLAVVGAGVLLLLLLVAVVVVARRRRANRLVPVLPDQHGQRVPASPSPTRARAPASLARPPESVTPTRAPARAWDGPEAAHSLTPSTSGRRTNEERAMLSPVHGGGRG